MLRAIFVVGWRPAEPLPFADRASLARDAQALRPHHNLTPPHVIEAVSRALRRQVHAQDLDRVLAGLPPGAAAFWHLPPDEAAHLTVRFP